MAGFGKLNHCCMKWIRSMVSIENGGLSVKPSGLAANTRLTGFAQFSEEAYTLGIV